MVQLWAGLVGRSSDWCPRVPKVALKTAYTTNCREKAKFCGGRVRIEIMATATSSIIITKIQHVREYLAYRRSLILISFFRAMVDRDEGGEMASGDEEQCSICFRSGKLDSVFANCGHMCCCYECASKMRACPLCRSSGRIIRVYR